MDLETPFMGLYLDPSLAAAKKKKTRRKKNKLPPQSIIATQDKDPINDPSVIMYHLHKPSHNAPTDLQTYGLMPSTIRVLKRAAVSAPPFKKKIGSGDSESSQSTPLTRQQILMDALKKDSDATKTPTNEQKVPANLKAGANIEPPSSVPTSSAGSVETNGHGAAQAARPKKQARRPQRPKNIKKPSKQKLHVSGFPASTTPEQLKETFMAFGPISLELLKPLYAIVVCGNAELRDAALGHEFNLNGVQLSVRADKSFGSRYSDKDSKLPKPSELDLLRCPHVQFASLLSQVRLQRDKLDNAAAVIKDIETVLRQEFQECEAFSFGSLTTGLAVHGSDADCYVKMNDDYWRGQHQRVIVKKAAILLRKRADLFSDVLPIPNAHTPIVKVVHRRTQMPADISFKTLLGVRNSRLVAHVLRRDARFLPFAIALKYWAHVHDLTGPGKLSNYALTMLLIMYLQLSGLLPAISDMQTPHNTFIVDGWETGFEDNNELPDRAETPELNDDHSVHSLIGNFFRYYASFDFYTLAVCPFIGRPIQKSAFRIEADLPAKFEQYKSNVASGVCRPLRIDRPLVIQDPFELSQNVSSAINTKQAVKLQQFFRLCYNNFLSFRETLFFLPSLFSIEPIINLKTNFHPKCMAEIDLSEIGGEGWEQTVVAAARRALEHCCLLPLVVNSQEKVRETPYSTRVEHKYTSTIDFPVWDRAAVEGEETEGLGPVERERWVSTKLATSAGSVPGVWMQVSLTTWAQQNLAFRDAGIEARLVEGPPPLFPLFGGFVQQVVTRLAHDLAVAALRERPDPPPPHQAPNEEAKSD